MLRALIASIAREHAILFPRLTDAQIAKKLNRDIAIISEARKLVNRENDSRLAGVYRQGFSGSNS